MTGDIQTLKNIPVTVLPFFNMTRIEKKRQSTT